MSTKVDLSFLNGIPHMMSDDELKFLFELLKKNFSGKGIIVDLGCRFGASTLVICKALQHVKTKQKICACDTFHWDEECETQLKNHPDKEYFKNNGYLALFKENLSNFIEDIELIVDIRNSNIQTPVEILIVDVMKSEETAQLVIEKYYKALIPGKSFVYQQDFDHFLTPWVQVISYLYRNYFYVYKDIKNSGGIWFFYKKLIPDELLHIEFHTLPESEIDKAFRWALKISNKKKHKGIAAAHVMFYIYRKDKNKAFDLWCQYLYQGYELSGEFVDLQRRLEELK
ncbi:MAG: hypothetical protein WHW07_05565 [Bacteroidales bacterium]